ncbi:MAG: DUF2905 domain-containing protein [Candidatus Edwardsbacteria bacterium]
MSHFAKLFILLGLMFLFCGVLLIIISKIPFLGHLPGDIRIERPGFRVYFPLVTCLLLSIVLTIVLNLILRK